MAERWREEMNRREAEHKAEIRRILEEKKKFMEDELAKKSDPAAAVQVVYELEVIKFQLGSPQIPVEITPDEYLAILDRTEQWYVSREYPYPQPLRLEEQRAHWEQCKVKALRK